ncbi:MAG TPA: MFS transporter [Dehalococcoidia bacterium]|nr:MFS transporter [Dehalococcoidia bacterium]
MRAIRIPRLFHNRDYLLLWAGQTVSATGTSVSDLAFPLLVLALTHSAAAAGAVAALRALPALLFMLPGGALVDRWDRRRTMLFCDAGRALSLAAIVLAFALGRLTLALVCLVAFVEGSLGVVFGLAETACLPHVVPAEQLAAAVAQSEVTEGAVALVGPSLGGLLFAAGRALPFLCDAASYAASLAGLLAMRVRLQGERTAVHEPLHREVREAVVWLWRQPLLRGMTMLNLGGALASPAMPLIVIVLAQRQHAGAGAIGLIFAAEGAGMILGALLGIWSERRLRVGQAVLLCRGAGLLLWLLLAVAPNAFALGVIAFAFGLIDPIEDVPYFSERHRLIPDEIEGRVLAVCRLAPSLTRPPGLLLVGVLLQRLGAVSTVLIAAAWLAALLAVVGLSPALRQAPNPAAVRDAV